jgi:hypothetical protein
VSRDGGPAFPEISTTLETVGSGGDYTSYPNVESSGGMTLRDYFAAKAMQGMAAGIHWHDSIDKEDGHIELAAETAYAMADAMLAARGESP